jgi:hypothetical protein
VTPAARLAALEAAYLAAREARDRLDVARATGEAPDLAGLDRRAAEASAAVHAGLAAFDPVAAGDLSPDDRRAFDRIRDGMAEADAYSLPVAPEIAAEVAPGAGGGSCGDPGAWDRLIVAGGKPLHQQLEACYAATADALAVGGEVLSRPQVLGRLGTEPDPGVRRDLFLALAPLWRVVDGDDEGGSPYRALIREASQEARLGRSRLAANAAGLGVAPDEITSWAEGVLEAWRTAVVESARAAGEPPVEPWDWWWHAGAVGRAVGPISVADIIAVNRAVYASLGADLDELRVRLDITPRPGRRPVPVAFTTFGGRPHRQADGSWMPGQPTVLATYVDGGLGELAELVHETGHAIHIAGIRARPAFADWPDADALTEALADIVAYNVADPAWLHRWLPGNPIVPAETAARCHYAGVVMDAAWALFEMRMLDDPGRRPNDVWTDLTSTWLGVAAHPEWSWWAIRGQLVQEPGYMGNYAAGSVLAAALRAVIRAERGDWTLGDAGWYAWLRDRILRFGRERSAGDAVREVLGQPPTAHALLAEIATAARAG